MQEMNILNRNRKIRRDRYLTNGRLKPVTVCIAAICHRGIRDNPNIIVFCADRLVSAGIQFEGGEPKIKKITDYCYAMQSSNDSLVSDLILKRVKQKASEFKEPEKIEKIVEMLRHECFVYKKEWTENAILSKYNLVFEKLGVTPESIVNSAVKEVGECQYPFEFEFIVFGIELSKEAHLFVVNQDSQYSLQDSLGFAVIGSGGSLAFLEMTKYGYHRNFPAPIAIPRVYFAKKVSERAEGVGRYTDFLALFLGSDPSGTKFLPMVVNLLNDPAHPDFGKKLDETYETIRANEVTELNKLHETVQKMFAPKPQQPQA